MIGLIATSKYAKRVPSNEKPTVATLRATKVSSQSATLTGTVNAHGLPTRVWFEYGTSGSYDNKTSTRKIRLFCKKWLGIKIEDYCRKLSITTGLLQTIAQEKIVRERKNVYNKQRAMKSRGYYNPSTSPFLPFLIS
ncbi:MAG: hypothetical protein U0586_04030 [Candidatus Brocadiaceae bacterium]